MTGQLVEPVGAGRPLRVRKKEATRAALHEAAFRLVAENGLAAVTVEMICAAADVSPRTFFNYYPTKASAVFDMVPAVISPKQQEDFLSSQGDLLEDTVAFTAENIQLPTDVARLKELLQRHEGLSSEFWKLIRDQLIPLIALLEKRCDGAHEAWVIFGLVFAATNAAVRTPSAARSEDIRARLLAEISAMRALLDSR